MEELRIQKDKNLRLEEAFKKDEETKKKQAEKMKDIEDKNKQYKDELNNLKEKSKQLGLDRDNSGSLPPIENEEEKQKLREDLENEYFNQRNQLKKIENQTKTLELKAEELKLKLKEKETMLRISKFKLSDVNRNIKHGTLKPIDSKMSDE